MKHLILIIAIASLFSCKEKQEIANKSKETTSFLWTITLNNGKQKTAGEMTQTKYIFLTDSDQKVTLCDGSGLINEIAYKEEWQNTQTVENPLWVFEYKNVKTIKARQIIEIACNNEDAVFTMSSNKQFPEVINKYPEFKKL